MEQGNLTELINIVREKAKIEEVIGDYIEVTRKGASYYGLCPFHMDSNPSMSISPAKGIFKCFSCGAGGNVISFVQNHEGISFIEAVKKLADKYEIDWKEYISERKQKPVDPEILEIRKVNQEALIFFKYQLENELLNKDSEVYKYLQTRKITKEDIHTFNLGFASAGNSLSNFLIKKGFEESTIIKAGLAKDTENGLRDYFYNRLLFTIADTEGNVIGFSGRQLTDDKNMPKYINTAETKAFKKGEFLYNFHRARSPISLRKKVIIVEGYMDVIALSKIGVENVVASMGTAFTKLQTEIIKRSTKKVLLAMDADVAGINATISTAKSLYEEGLYEIEVLKHDRFKDVDELISNTEQTKVMEVLDKSVVTFEDYYRTMVIGSAKPNFEAIRKFLQLLAVKNNPMEVSMHINEISNKYGINPVDIRNEYDSFVKTNVVTERKTGNDIEQQIRQDINMSDFADHYAEDFEEQEFIEVKEDNLNTSLRNDELGLIRLASENGAQWRTFASQSYRFHSKVARDLFWALEKYYNSNRVTEKDVEAILSLMNGDKDIARKVIDVDQSEMDDAEIKVKIKELRNKCQETLSVIRKRELKENIKNLPKEELMALLDKK